MPSPDPRGELTKSKSTKSTRGSASSDRFSCRFTLAGHRYCGRHGMYKYRVGASLDDASSRSLRLRIERHGRRHLYILCFLRHAAKIAEIFFFITIVVVICVVFAAFPALTRQIDSDVGLDAVKSKRVSETSLRNPKLLALLTASYEGELCGRLFPLALPFAERCCTTLDEDPP